MYGLMKNGNQTEILTGIQEVTGMPHPTRVIIEDRGIGNAAAVVIYGFKVAGADVITEGINYYYILRFKRALSKKCSAFGRTFFLVKKT